MTAFTPARIWAAAAVCAALLLPDGARAYTTDVHANMVADAVKAFCRADPAGAPCMELSKYAKYAAFGAVMEDDFKQGETYTFGDAMFTDEEAPEAYCFDGHPYCSHYWFGEAAGGAGITTFGATNPTTPSAVIAWLFSPPRKWDSAWGRTVKIWNGKVIPNYARGNYPQAYYWLGRAAHLLADMGVPQHVTPHPAVSTTELKHRCYELRVHLRYPAFARRTAEDGISYGGRDPYSLFLGLSAASRQAAGYTTAGNAPQRLSRESKRLFNRLPAVPEEDGRGSFYYAVIDHDCADTFGAELDNEASVLVPQAIESVAGLFGFFYSRAPGPPPELSEHAGAR